MLIRSSLRRKQVRLSLPFAANIAGVRIWWDSATFEIRVDCYRAHLSRRVYYTELLRVYTDAPSGTLVRSEMSN